MNTNTRALFIALAIAGASGGPTTSDAQETSIAPSVVNLDVVSDVPDLKAPWQTEGIVSRIEVDTYIQSNRGLLSVQIDAAINEGNSGGPVVIDGAQGKWLRIVTGDGWVLTLDLGAARRASGQILQEHGIAQDRYFGVEPRPSRKRGKRHR
ncbi:MAG: hypothetical protein JRJ80_10620 [Deltaproteobacteria bacterium]|nr:hypothetical protein [Deltaproteobacteria bacterium]